MLLKTWSAAQIIKNDWKINLIWEIPILSLEFKTDHPWRTFFNIQLWHLFYCDFGSHELLIVKCEYKMKESSLRRIGYWSFMIVLNKYNHPKFTIYNFIGFHESLTQGKCFLKIFDHTRLKGTLILPNMRSYHRKYMYFHISYLIIRVILIIKCSQTCFYNVLEIVQNLFLLSKLWFPVQIFLRIKWNCT